jgi:hypothetical protein
MALLLRNYNGHNTNPKANPKAKTYPKQQSPKRIVQQQRLQQKRNKNKPRKGLLDLIGLFCL